jgi:hypothetical protein
MNCGGRRLPCTKPVRLAAVGKVFVHAVGHTLAKAFTAAPSFSSLIEERAV